MEFNWIEVQKGSPEVGEEYLIVFGEGGFRDITIAVLCQAKDAVWWQAEEKVSNVTHYAPKPDLP